MGKQHPKFKCQQCGECCGVFPIPIDIYMKHIDDIQTIPKTCIQSKRYIFAITEGLRCIFLTEGNKCSIYKDRPKVCKKFGVDIKLPCPKVKLNGTLRTPEETEKILKDVTTKWEKFVKQVEQ